MSPVMETLEWPSKRALDAMNVAQNQLQIAAPDKGGHRVNAINLVQQAIDETNLGIQAGGGSSVLS
jgi:hypothetical protein